MKPTKRGIKVFCLCDARTGFLINFDVYVGHLGNQPQRNLCGHRCFEVVGGIRRTKLPCLHGQLVYKHSAVHGTRTEGDKSLWDNPHKPQRIPGMFEECAACQPRWLRICPGRKQASYRSLLNVSSGWWWYGLQKTESHGWHDGRHRDQSANEHHIVLQVHGWRWSQRPASVILPHARSEECQVVEVHLLLSSRLMNQNSTSLQFRLMLAKELVGNFSARKKVGWPRAQPVVDDTEHRYVELLPASKGRQCKNCQRKRKQERAANRKGKRLWESCFGCEKCGIVLCKGQCWQDWHSQPAVE